MIKEATKREIIDFIMSTYDNLSEAEKRGKIAIEIIKKRFYETQASKNKLSENSFLKEIEIYELT